MPPDSTKPAQMSAFLKQAKIRTILALIVISIWLGTAGNLPLAFFLVILVIGIGIYFRTGKIVEKSLAKMPVGYRKSPAYTTVHTASKAKIISVSVLVFLFVLSLIGLWWHFNGLP